MLEYERGKRVEVSGLLSGLRGAITPELGDVDPIYTEKRPHRSHMGPHKTRLLSAKLRFGLQFILDGLEQPKILFPEDSNEDTPVDPASKEDMAARLAYQEQRAIGLAKKGELTGPWRHFMQKKGLSRLLQLKNF